MRSKHETASSFLPERTYRSPSIFKVVRSSASLSTICRYSLIAALILPCERNFSAAFRTLALSKAIRNLLYHENGRRRLYSSSGQRDKCHVEISSCQNSTCNSGKQPRDTLTRVNKGCQRRYFQPIFTCLHWQSWGIELLSRAL